MVAQLSGGTSALFSSFPVLPIVVRSGFGIKRSQFQYLATKMGLVAFLFSTCIFGTHFSGLCEATRPSLTVAHG